MSDDAKTAVTRAAEKAFTQTLRDHQASTRERETAEADAAEEAKIARLRAARLAKEASDRKA